SDNPISRSDPSAGVKEVVNMLVYTGLSGLCPSDLCLFSTDLGRGPYSKTPPQKPYGDTFLMRYPLPLRQG
ncbi:hypothetical protein, partial [uncultured Porphyromonas sp.]|uniref:hypothetical protein n=1 Tax=uncultured Porphyromonas sp. TaxID=159274 RepID=UPI00258945C7